MRFPSFSSAPNSFVLFEVSREMLRIGVGKDVVQLWQDIRDVSLKRLLRDCSDRHRKQQSVLVENGEGGRESPEAV
jgi:hypothetical protein